MKTEEDIRIESLHRKAKQLLKKDLDEDQVINELKKEGIDSNYANLIIENVIADSRNRIDGWKLYFTRCKLMNWVYQRIGS